MSEKTPYALAAVDEIAKRANAKLPQGIAWHAHDARDAILELYEAARGPLCHSDFQTRTQANLRLAHALLRFEGRKP
jgi:hypothetical protein